MKVASLVCLIAVSASADVIEVAADASVSLLQHSARTIQKVSGLVKEPDPEAVERMRARRRARRAHPDFEPSAAQQARRNARRQAKRQGNAEGKRAGQRHFGDSGTCDLCLEKCSELFEDIFKECMIDRECRPWQKEDGPSSDKCMKRCDRAANWQRTPCNRKCMCDADELALFEASAEVNSEVELEWVGSRHRCRDAGIGQVSDCVSVAQDRESIKYDSIHKCAKAAQDANADTFNFYRTAKEFGKCDLKNSGSEDLKLVTAAAEPEAPAGHGGWKVFSTFCAAPPPNEQGLNGDALN